VPTSSSGASRKGGRRPGFCRINLVYFTDQLRSNVLGRRIDCGVSGSAPDNLGRDLGHRHIAVPPGRALAIVRGVNGLRDALGVSHRSAVCCVSCQRGIHHIYGGVFCQGLEDEETMKRE